MSKQSYYCPFDDKTKIIRVPDEIDNIFIQCDKHENDNPSTVFKFSKCKTSETSVQRKFQKTQNANLNYFYKANDIWEFNNIGVSKPPTDIKKPEILKLKNFKNGDIHVYVVVRYLVCGDCDKGAFGFGGYKMDYEDIQKHLEIGYDLLSVNPNDLEYFFYV